MQRTTRVHGILAFILLFGAGGGCVAIYRFENFDKEKPDSCSEPKNCPGTDACSLRVCEQGLCIRTNPVPADIYPDGQIEGDCKRIKCDGKGNDILENDPIDLPFDANECTTDTCTDGIPKNVPDATKTCGTSSKPLQCNNAGFCTGCATDSDCGVSSNPCNMFQCVAQICTRVPQNVGLILDNAVAGDCTAIVCTAEGEAAEGFAPSDALQDANICTVETCNMDGSIAHDDVPEGKKCGDCLVCTKGACGSCNATTSDCYAKDCIPKPQSCKVASDCATGYCIDDFCCDSECASPCMACSNAKTGLPSGYCSKIPDGTDPDEECNNPTGDTDTCRDRSCGCENGIRDGNEAGVDCGGDCAPCTGKWNCGGVSTCAGIGAQLECCYFCSCPNESADCKTLEGQTCAIGAANRTFTVGTTSTNDCLFTPSVCRSVTCKCQ